VVNAAAGALGALGDSRAGPPLVALLGAPDQPTRRAAAAALGELRSSAAVPALTGALHDPDPVVRAAALNALGDIGDPDSLPAALTAVHDPDAQVVRQVPHVLGQLHRAGPGTRWRPASGRTAPRAVVALALGIAGIAAIPGLMAAWTIPMRACAGTRPTPGTPRGGGPSTGALTSEDGTPPGPHSSPFRLSDPADRRRLPLLRNLKSDLVGPRFAQDLRENLVGHPPEHRQARSAPRRSAPP
jgi:hypothetical protein